MPARPPQGGTPRITIIDGVLYSNTEFHVAKWLIKNVDANVAGLESLPGCHRCFHWFDSPRRSMKQILEGRGWWPKPGTTPVNLNGHEETYACKETSEAGGGRAALPPAARARLERHDEMALITANLHCELFRKCEGKGRIYPWHDNSS